MNTANHLRQEFESHGFVPRLPMLTPDEMRPYNREFDRLERVNGKEASQVGLQNLHLVNPPVWELASHPNVLAAMTAILGPDLLLLGTHFFCKQPNLSESFVAWHQDVTYWGLAPPIAATLWLSLDGATEENGCMQVIPKSHFGGLLSHSRADRAGNLLSVNQALPPGFVEESQAVNVELRPGEASIHHGMLIHGSGPNRSMRRRTGLTMRFTTPAVQPSNEPGAVQWKPILLQGEDAFRHFDLQTWPEFAG